MTARSEESQDHRPAVPAPDDLGATGPEAEAEAKAADRVVVFSDAVIAIAITLLALDLPVPGGTHLTNGQFWHALTADRSYYLAFLVSFVVIGNHWVTHRRIFRYVARLDGHVGQLNMLWLLVMIFTPVATRMVAGGGATGVRFAIYSVVQIIATGCLLQMSREVRQGGMLRADAPDSARHPDIIPLVAIILAFAVSIPVAFVVSWAWVFWVASPLVARVLRLFLARGRPAPASPGPHRGHRAPR